MRKFVLIDFWLLLALTHLGGVYLLSWKIGNVDLLDIPFVGIFSGEPGKGSINSLIASDATANAIEDSFLKTPDLVRKYGYPSEMHRVVTADGYILEMHRIPRQGAIPVLLTHGILDSSATWVMMGPAKSLAYLLYGLGYDIWMLNVRGNCYSRNHTTHSTSDKEFWDFSFHEMGVYDLPACIDYVLSKTDYSQLHYIGHSQGTTAFWVMASECPEYMTKIRLMQALAPVAFMENTESPLVNNLSDYQKPLSDLTDLIGLHEFLPSNVVTRVFSQFACVFSKDICSNIMFKFFGYDRSQLNETLLPIIVGHTPAGAAVKQLKHFGQLKTSGQFRKFDYGWKQNKLLYKQPSPPAYKLENANCKVALYYAKNDWLVAIRDVEHLARLLPNVVRQFLVDYNDFNHVDFTWAIDAKELLWNHMFKLMHDVDKGKL